MATDQYPPSEGPQPVYLADYAAPAFRIEYADLTFTLDPRKTRVRAKLTITCIQDRRKPPPLELQGENLNLISIALNGRTLSPEEYALTDDLLIIPSPPRAFTLDTEVEISPESNKALEGLYRSNGVYCTQCEPEGFRRIAYFMDRPDVMAIYSTTIIASKAECPVLLSNGNPMESGELDGGLHFAKWHDPFPKPSYLFALVAGDLANIEDNFITRSGRDVKLQIFVENGNESRALYAMDALKRAMRWDEDTYGCEYDLEVFNIVAVSEFNMGAMENKGLNIFNDRFILADPETATDMDYYLIESIIAHEYFHNWSGNRVTCRDWFQLSLKEGLTVFRDQEFTADVRDSACKRIDDVNVLRVSQFVEDSGPFAHPVRPNQYVEINNFYTSTVYQKGAEVIRMMKTILGEEAFFKGIRLYFSRYDGQAVTCDDFVAAMEEASGNDLTQFKLWYSQAGTPHVEARGVYDAESSTYKLTLWQSCNSTPGQPDKEPFHIPIAVGLVGEDGMDIPLGESRDKSKNTVVLELKKSTDQFTFSNISSKNPRLSLNRKFSSPITVSLAQSSSDQVFLSKYDSDAFNRWAANQERSVSVVLDALECTRESRDVILDSDFLDALTKITTDVTIENAFKASLLALPSEDYISTRMIQEDPINLSRAHRTIQKSIGLQKGKVFQQLLEELENDDRYVPDAAGMGLRMLKKVSLSYLTATEARETIEFAKDLFVNATNMTEKIDALNALNSTDTPQRIQALSEFYEQFKNNHLVINKWFQIQASAPLPRTLETVKQLIEHPLFDLKNPNKVRSVIGAFSNMNPINFHSTDGSGYSFLAEKILEIDTFNPQLAARLILPLGRWKRFAAERQVQMKAQLERLAASSKLSRDTSEMVSRSLDS